MTDGFGLLLYHDRQHHGLLGDTRPRSVLRPPSLRRGDRRRSTHLANGSWIAERISAHPVFSYNLSGVLAAVSLTYSDGTPIEGRVGSYVVSINEIGIGFSSPNDRSGKCLLWMPYTVMESIPYIACNWSISLFSNLSGSPSAVPSLLPSLIRFTAISGQFLMHNDTHLALQAFDWGSDRLER